MLGGGVTEWFILLYFGLYDSNFKVLATHFGNFWKKKTTIYIQNIPSILVLKEQNRFFTKIFDICKNEKEKLTFRTKIFKN